MVVTERKTGDILGRDRTVAHIPCVGKRGGCRSHLSSWLSSLGECSVSHEGWYCRGRTKFVNKDSR